MNFRPLRTIDTPEEEGIENPHLGVSFDYNFMGQPLGQLCILLTETRIYDHQEKLFIRRTENILSRSKVKECIRLLLEKHLLARGVDRVQVNGLLREFQVDVKKCREYNEFDFYR